MAGVPPKKNSEFTVYTCVVSQADTDIFQVNPTIAAGDFQVSTDDGAFGNPGTLPAVDPAAGRQIKIVLSAAEMNGDVITVIGSDQAGDEWCDVFIQLFTDDRYAFGLNLLLNPGFETGGTGGDFNGGAEIDDGTSDDFTSWTEAGVNDGTGDKCEATATVPGVSPGSVAVKFTNTTSPNVRILQTIAVIPGARYALDFWTKGDGAQPGRYNVYDLSNSADIIVVTATGITAAVYAQVTDYFTAPHGCTSVSIRFYVSAAAGVCYFDDVSLIEQGVVAITADAVWDEVSTDHIDADKAGQQIWTDLDAVLADTNELQTDDIPAAIAALNDLSAAQVNTEADAALSDYDPPTKTELDSGLAALNDPSEAEIWAYATRTLTTSAASVAAALEGSDINILRGDTLSVTLTGLGNISDRSKLWLTLKRSPGDADSEAIVQVEETAGLIVLNGATTTASNSTLVVDDQVAGDITWTLKAAAAFELIQRTYDYDVQVLRAAGVVNTLTEGDAVVSLDTTKAIA